jgi:hypothetical protein
VRHLVGLIGGDQLEVRRSEKKLHRCMELFLVKGGSFYYDHESIDEIEVPLR